MNMGNLMAQAQKMQRDMQNKQNEIYAMDFEGESQLVKIVMSGKKIVKSVEIKNKETMNAEDLEMLEDMLKIAFNDALSKVDKEFENKLGAYSKQLGGLI